MGTHSVLVTIYFLFLSFGGYSEAQKINFLRTKDVMPECNITSLISHFLLSIIELLRNV